MIRLKCSFRFAARLFAREASGDLWRSWRSCVVLQLILALSCSCVFAQPVQTIVLDGAGTGKRFDGIGVVNGGGATSVLLKDYPEPQRSQIFDLVYKPMFGASVSVLLVEIPGDGNST